MSSTLLTRLVMCLGVLLLASCTGNTDKTTTTDTLKSDTGKMMDAPANANTTIVTSAQPMLNIRARVANFNKWLESYEARDSARAAAGMQNYVIGRGVEDTNIVIIALKTDNIETAKTFANNPATKQAMQKGGLTNPSFNFITLLWQDTAPNTADIRSLTTFTVKDWANWESNFKEGKQERIDNGISDRVYGHDADNDKKVMLVVAVSDSAKAAAYWNSDALKARREKGGVTSKVDRFLFRVVRRY